MKHYVAEAKKIITEIYGLVDELPESGEDYGASVEGKTQEIEKYINEHDFVTAPQVDALTNMRDGLNRWF